MNEKVTNMMRGLRNKQAAAHIKSLRGMAPGLVTHHRGTRRAEDLLIVWSKLLKTGLPWHFCIPAASCVFDLDKSAPCFCILQAANTLHCTLHHPDYDHDGCGMALVSSSRLMSKAAQDLMKSGGKRPRL